MRRLLPTLILFLVTGLTAPAAPVPVEPARPDQLFTITTHRYGTKISPTGERDRVVLESRSGIGGAVIKRRGATWPRTVIVRLHVRALEGFGMWAGDSQLGVDAVVWTNDYCDIRLPPDFLRGNPESFKLEWVDFYRR